MAAARKAQSDTAPDAPETEDAGAAVVAPVESGEGESPATGAEAVELGVTNTPPVDTGEGNSTDAEAESARRFKVTGAAVVLRTVDGAERYLYRGAPFLADAFVQASVDHAVAVGLIAETE